MKFFTFFLVAAFLSMLVISTSAAPTGETEKIDSAKLSPLGRQIKAELEVVSRKLSDGGKTKGWVCWDCWARGYCCPSQCAQNC